MVQRVLQCYIDEVCPVNCCALETDDVLGAFIHATAIRSL